MKSLKYFLCIAILLTAYHGNAGALPPQAKIIGGKPADANAWPWMAAIVFKDNNELLLCGGSLIAPQWVLTSASCLQYESPTGSGQFVTLDPTLLEVHIKGSQTEIKGSERISPNQVLIHPGYNPASLSNDIALLHLSTPSATTPIETLPDFSVLDEAGQQNAIALGWGSTSASQQQRQIPKALQQVTLPLISNALCKKSMGDIEDSMLCAGLAQGGLDTCDTDGGGPLIVFDVERNTWLQAGITSYGGVTCAAAGFYGVYTRLDKFKDIITQATCTAEQTPTAPTLSLTTTGNTVTAKWTTNPSATGYRLNWAPYPSLSPILSAELGSTGQLSATLPSGSAYYVAVNAYQNNCRGAFSNIVVAPN